MRIQAEGQAYRMQEWAALIKEQQQSGLKKKDWCALNGYSRDQYFYWQRRIREYEKNQEETERTIRGESGTPRGWATIKAPEAQRSRIINANGLTVSVGEYAIGVTYETDMRLLSKVCETLSAVSARGGA